MSWVTSLKYPLREHHEEERVKTDWSPGFGGGKLVSAGTSTWHEAQA